MKNLILIGILFLASCGKDPDAPATGGISSGESSSSSSVAGCAVYDSCTYSGGWGNEHPVYTCTAKTYQKVNTNIPEEYYEGHTCLTTKEDFHTVYGLCGMPPNQFPCPYQAQGPGPLAIPELGL